MKSSMPIPPPGFVCCCFHLCWTTFFFNRSASFLISFHMTHNIIYSFIELVFYALFTTKISRSSHDTFWKIVFQLISLFTFVFTESFISKYTSIHAKEILHILSRVNWYMTPYLCILTQGNNNKIFTTTGIYLT